MAAKMDEMMPSWSPCDVTLPGTIFMRGPLPPAPAAAAAAHCATAAAMSGVKEDSRFGSGTPAGDAAGGDASPAGSSVAAGGAGAGAAAPAAACAEAKTAGRAEAKAAGSTAASAPRSDASCAADSCPPSETRPERASEPLLLRGAGSVKMISAQTPLSTNSSSERLDRVASEHMVQVKQQRAASR